MSAITKIDGESETEFYLREGVRATLLGACRKIMDPYTEAEDTSYGDTIKAMSAPGQSMRQAGEWSVLAANYNKLLRENLSLSELLLMAEELRDLASYTKALGPINKQAVKKMFLA